MALDLRVPIGLLFGLLGLLLAGYGVVSDPGLYEKSLGINVNLVWGAVMLVFGLGMLGLAWRGRGRANEESR
jgi:hypothetical protein